MSQKIPSRKTRDLARQLLAYEVAALNASERNTAAVFQVSEKLRRPLITLAGATGFRTLLARALTLARAHTPSLAEIQVKADGSLEGLSEFPDDGKAAEAGVLLIAQLLGLLELFIGEDLVLHLVLDVWPELPAPDLESK